ncbi:hypothetical protein COLO4_02397 [Corchorus olitorius]|uniref:Uncharacterized protein n=1 Tax=Corchorus olitorius TaxID=93759 RepID=A0A1R3L129_9ROSI|nr:hypothetical protein COLO4_02397 [Corchorus olitorius]
MTSEVRERSSEEEDNLNRSTKKVKASAAAEAPDYGNPIQDDCGGMWGQPPRMSFRDAAMGSRDRGPGYDELGSL